MFVGWRTAPWHDEARHTVGVTRLGIAPHSDAVPRTLGPQSGIHADTAHGSPQTCRDTVPERCGHITLSHAAPLSRQRARVPGNALSGGEVAGLRSPPPQSARVK